MTRRIQSETTRRGFIKTTGSVAAASTLVTGAMRRVHAAQNSQVQIALVGCGGRGTGAAENALKVPDGNTKLVAMADVFENRLNACHRSLAREFNEKVDVPEDQRFISFEGYKQAMDCLDPGDIVILATPPAFRWVMYTYAIEKGLNVFMEKPVTIDAPTSRRMLEINKLAQAKNLKVAVGLMCRHCEARQELFDRIKNGEIGDILMLRAYRMAGPTGSAAVKPNDTGMSDLMYQISKFHGFLWASGGAVSDFLIHNIDECCWMKDAWPVEAKASGGRHYREDYIDQNFDTYSIEYTFGDGTKLFVDGRTVPGCHNEFASYAHGTKSCATISAAAHTPAHCKIYTGQKFTSKEVRWEFPDTERTPYQLEWNDLLDAIRNDRPYNEVERGVMASAVTSMGRMAAHTGQVITLEDFMDFDHEFAPGVDKLTMESEAPVKPDAQGRYPVPMPGLVTEREYAG
ncbi:MAG: Gfo/Idh/MocA family oxidoreductase [Planctomycetales bacterium]|nr:Gfo/Idh/MocA family oxidoreductase [Planctomycetales bacterium]